MTQEEKDKRKSVIFDELCRRAPYGTFCYVPSYNKPLLLIGANSLSLLDELVNKIISNANIKITNQD